MNKDYTLNQIIKTSQFWYRTQDNKRLRANMDVVRGTVKSINRLVYNKSTHQWEREPWYASRIDMLISTRPVSYRKIDTIKTHRYPVTFLIKNVKKGLDSPFRWRTGSWKKPIIPKRGQKLTKKQRINIANLNIQKQVQLQFFFELEWALKQKNLLFGPNWAGWPPKITNRREIPFFDKHAWFALQKIIFPLIKSGRLLKSVKN